MVTLPCLARLSLAYLLVFGVAASVPTALAEMDTEAARSLSKSDSNAAEPALMAKASSRVLSAQWLLDGSALPKCATENLEGFAKLYSQELGPEAVSKMSPQRLSWASACSGTEGAYYVAEAINSSFEKAKIPISLEHKFSCEQQKDKQKWIHAVLACGRVQPGTECKEDKAADEDDSDVQHACIFADIQELGQGTAQCVTHAKKCAVPEADIFICGVSCKDVSRQNPHRSQTKLVMAEKESRGGTSQTWGGFVAYVSTRQPGIVVFENVDGLDDNVGPTAQSNLDIVLGQMSRLGYTSQMMSTEAAEFGCPARRRRFYILFVKKCYCKFGFQDRSLPSAIAMFRSMVASCARSAPCVSEVLLDSCDPAVAAGLHQAQQRKARADERAEQALAKQAKAQSNAAASASVSKSASSKASKSAAAAWVDQHLKLSDALGVCWGQPVSQDLEVNECFLTLTDRGKDVLLLSRSQAQDAGFRNLSQSVMRVRCTSLNRETGKHLAPTMLPGQLLFVELVQPPRFLLGREALILQGFPVQPFFASLRCVRL